MRTISLVVLASALAACGESGGAGTDDGGASEDDRAQRDMFLAEDSGEEPAPGGEGGGGGGGEAGQGGAAGAGGDLPPDLGLPDMAIEPDAAPPLDCPGVCAAYFACDGAITLPFPDAAACEELCGASNGAAGRAWRTCVTAAAGDCPAIHDCAVPEPPPRQLTCAETCQLLTDCGDADAGAACAAFCESPAADALAACSPPLDRGQCETQAFYDCAGRALPGCEGFCRVAPACGLSSEDRCPLDCAATVLVVDPIARENAGELLDCVSDNAANCPAAQACTQGGGGPFNQEVFCQQWSACGFDFQFLPCDLFLQQFPLGQIPGAEQCMADLFARGCPAGGIESLFQCLNGGPLPEPLPDCQGWCHAHALCGDLPDGQDEMACIAACNRDAAEDPVLAVILPCGARAANCNDLLACEAGESPENRCGDACGALAACNEAVDAEACAAECRDGFLGAAWPAWAACVEQDLDCGALTEQCPLPAVGHCPAVCARLEECGLVGADGRGDCQVDCEQRATQDAIGFGAVALCVLRAEECSSRDGRGFGVGDCWFGEVELPADPCLSHCQATTICGGERGFDTCLVSCVEPLPDDEAVLLANASECLLRARADCDALAACEAEAAGAPVDCDAICGHVADCGLEADVDCQASCAEAGTAACVFESARLGGGCAALAACVGFVPPEPAPDCAALCGRLAACDPAADAFLCERACPDDAATLAVRAGCAIAGGCADVGACVDLAGDLVVEGCAAPCEDAVACGAFPDAAACGAFCAGADASPSTDADYLADLGTCLDELGAGCAPDDARACFAGTSVDCEAACDAIAECFGGGDPTCVDGCEQAQRDNPEQNELAVACVLEFMGGGRCDPFGFQECIGEPIPIPQ